MSQARTPPGREGPAEPGRPTIRDVARRAGVGRGTVSRVINDQPNVSRRTRLKVEAAIAELRFLPNPVGRQLSLGRSMTVGVIAPFLTRPSVVDRLRGVAGSLGGSGYDMIAFDVESVERRDVVFRDVLTRHSLDGLIVISIRPRPGEVATMADAGMPCVLVDTSHPCLPRVVIDDVGGGALATRHLLELGHRRVAFIGDVPDSSLGFSSSRLRSWGFRKAIVAAGLPFSYDQVVVARHDRATARDLARRLLCSPDRPTGIVCASDTQAFGVLEAAQSLGVPVPEGLSVTGYDDLEVASFLSLTTVRQPLVHSGARGWARLLDLLEGRPSGPLREALPVELVVRGTTAPPA